MAVFIKPISEYNNAQKSILAVIFFSITRIILSPFLALGNDESYYWTYSQHLQWNYFDHPPMVAVLIKITTLGLWLQHQVFFIRLGSFIGCAIGSYFIYKTIANISTGRAAYLGVFLYNCSFYASVTAGLLITPDSPQMIFWTASLYFITKIFEDEKLAKYWICFGIAAGLAIMSKVHSVFLWEGVFLYAVLYKRTIFKLPYFYIAAIITAIIISPILFWNIANDFITYRFHSARVIEHESNTFHWFGLLKELVGQVVINNPFNIAFVLLFFKLKRSDPKSTSSITVFTLIALPLLAIICCLAIFRNTLPHWSGPAYITLVPLAAIGLSNINLKKINVVLKAATAYFLIFAMLIIYAVNFYPGSFGSKTLNELGKNDISLDAYGWKQAGEKFVAMYNVDNASKPAKDKPPLVCNTWWGAHDEYYFALPLGIKMVGLGSTQNIHQYAWKNKFDSVGIKMDTVYCMMHSYDYVHVKNVYADYYKNIDSVANIQVLRSNKVAYNFVVYKLSGYKQR